MLLFPCATFAALQVGRASFDIRIFGAGNGALPQVPVYAVPASGFRSTGLFITFSTDNITSTAACSRPAAAERRARVRCAKERVQGRKGGDCHEAYGTEDPDVGVGFGVRSFAGIRRIRVQRD